MWTVPKHEVANLLKLDLAARRREAEERERLFEQTYERPFDAFERAVLDDETEHYEAWDDYIEWKAYRKLQRDLENKLNALDRGDFTVA